MSTQSFANPRPRSSDRESRSGFGILRGSFRHSLGIGLLYCVVLEASIFGSGRLLQVGPVTVKMVLFALALIYTLWCLLSLDRIRLGTAILAASFLFLLCFATVNGLIHGAHMSLIEDDLSPLLSLLILPFFDLTIRTRHALSIAIKIMICGAMVIALGYLAILVSLLFRLVSFATLYQWISSVGSHDFIFKGTNGRVFYKGAIYIVIALLFLIFQKAKFSKIISIPLVFLLLMIGSRGFFLALVCTGLVYAMIGPFRSTTKAAVCVFALVLGVLSVPLLGPMLTRSAADQNSNRVRITTVSQVSDRTTITSTIVGHGFGIGVPERREHMEIAYLEIFYKQGLLGLLWWATLFTVLAVRFARSVSRGRGDLAYPLLLTSVFIALESATNPFINNPIGMYPILISLAGLGVLSRQPASHSSINSSSPLQPGGA